MKDAGKQRKSPLKWHQSVNTKLFALVAFFVISTITYGTVLNGRTTRKTLAAQIQNQNVSELLMNWKILNQQISHEATLAHEALFSTVPTDIKTLQERVKVFLNRRPDVKGIRIDWFSEPLNVASQESTGNYLSSQELSDKFSQLTQKTPVFKEDAQENVVEDLFVTLIPNINHGIAMAFAASIKGKTARKVKIAVVYDGRLLLKNLDSSDKSSAFLVMSLSERDSGKKLKANTKQTLKKMADQVHYIGATDHDIDLLTKESESQLIKHQSQKLGITAWEPPVPDSLIHTMQKPLQNSTRQNTNVQLVMRFDRTASLDAMAYNLHQNIWFGLGILAVALFASYLTTVKFNQSLQKLAEGTRRIASGNLAPIHGLRHSEIGLLGESINMMSQQLNNLIEHRVRSVRKEAEILTTKAAEERFFLSEKKLPRSQIRITGTHQSASRCAGDWWCHFKVSHTSDLVVIADATGHGAEAALIVGIAYSFFQTYVQAVQLKLEVLAKPEDLLFRLNKILCETSDGSSTMAAQIWSFDHQSQTVLFANAGHSHPLATFTDSTASENTFEVRPIVQPGEILGMNHEAEFSSKAFSYHNLCRLFLYTDGLTECIGLDGKTMKIRTIKKNLDELAKELFPRAAARMVELVSQKFTGAAVVDDITLVQIEIPRKLAQVQRKTEFVEPHSDTKTAAELESAS